MTPRRSPAYPYLLLSGAVVASGAILVAFQSRLSFFLDEWDILIDRQGWSPSVFLDPHNDHIAIALVAVYKLLIAIFGIDSALPFNITAILVFLLAAVLLFLWMRERVGDWLALLGATLILFLGAGWEDLLSAFQLGYFGSMAAGLGALLALEREDRGGDAAACALVIVSISFSELGVPFAIAALVNVVLTRPRRLRRLYVTVVPLILYALWWLGWGHTANSSLSLHNIAVSPRFVVDAASATLSGLLGLSLPSTPDIFAPTGLFFGRSLLLVAVAASAWWLRRSDRGFTRGLWTTLALAATFWFLAGFNQSIARPPTSSRYVYPGAIFMLMIAAELLRGVRVSRTVLVGAAAVVGVAALANLSFLHQGYGFFKRLTDTGRSDLAALNIARPAVTPNFALNSRISTTWLVPVNAASYFQAVDNHGSPAFSEAELASRPADERAEADDVLVHAVGIELTPVPPARASARVARGGCDTVDPGIGAAASATLRPGTYTLLARHGGTQIRLGRFADGTPLKLGNLRGRSGELAIPRDLSSRPWRLGVAPGGGPVSVCDRAAT